MFIPWSISRPGIAFLYVVTSVTLSLKIRSDLAKKRGILYHLNFY